MCAGDIDNDGVADLYVTNFGRNRLFRNLAMAAFDDVAGAAGVAVDSWSTGCAFGDYDGDGWLDLFVAGYVALDVQNLPPGAAAAVQAPRQPTPPRRRAAGGHGRGVLGRRVVLHVPRPAA